MTVSVNIEGKGALSFKITGVASAANAGVGAIANPEGVSLIILRTTLFVTTQSTGAANLGIGVAADAVSKATDILNDMAVGGATGKMYNGHAPQTTAKTEITAPALWSSDKFVTLTGSATTAGLDATLYIEYLRV